MIGESHYWKTDLLRYSASLRKKFQQRRWSEASEVAVEKMVFLGFYPIRKLFEAQKLSTSLRTHQISILLYPPTSKAVTLINWHHTDKLFYLDRGVPSSVTLPFLCDQVIHSYVFQLGFTEEHHLDFMLLCSDRQRSKGLQQVSFADVASVFELVGNNYPHESRSVFNPKLKDYEVHNQ